MATNYTPPPRAYSYVRFSTPDQMRGDSYRRQVEMSREYAEQHGLDLDEVSTYKDLGVSAFRGKNTAEGSLGAFLEAVQAGRIPLGSYLLVESLDRLSRQAPHKAFLQFSGILESGVNIVTLKDRKLFKAGDAQLDFGDLMMAVAEMQRAHSESDNKSERLAHAWKKKRDYAKTNNHKMTGRCPEWLNLDKESGEFVVVEERAAVVRRIFQLASEGIGKRVIARTLNEDGVPTFGKSKGWQYSYVNKILCNEAVIGAYSLHKMRKEDDKRIPTGERIEDYFPRVVEPELFYKVRKMREGRVVPAGRVGASYANLFTGLAVCGVCGAPMHFENKGKPPKGGCYLVCSGARMKSTDCERHAWRYLETQSHILLNLFEVDYREVFPEVYAKNTDAIREMEKTLLIKEAEHRKAEQGVDRLVGLLLDRPDSAALLKKLDELEASKRELEEGVQVAAKRLDDARSKLNSCQGGYEEMGGAMRAFFDTVGTDAEYGSRRRLFYVLRKLLQCVTLAPGDGELHGTIEVRFKDADSHTRRIKVMKGQRDSKGYKAGSNDVEVAVVDAKWPPEGRILGGKALGAALGIPGY